jgi:hypothetical protein
VKNLFFILLFISSSLSVHAQYSAQIKNGADILAKATLNGDYKTLVDYTYPKAVAMAGGKQSMISLIKKGMDDMKKNGQGFKLVTTGEPGKVYRSGKELHSVVPQYMEMIYKNGCLSFSTSMLAVSQDDGKTWTYISAGNIAPERLKSMFPNLNKNLVIIKSTEPVFHTE